MSALLTIYIINATLLITHEIDSAYWKEWNLFKIPGGVNSFLILHLPIIGLVLLGLVLIALDSPAGIYISWILALSGIFAFGIHSYYLEKGHPEFRTTISQALLWAILLVSVELDEIFSLSDRIGVIYRGKIKGEFNTEDATENSLGILMAGGSLEQATSNRKRDTP